MILTARHLYIISTCIIISVAWRGELRTVGAGQPASQTASYPSQWVQSFRAADAFKTSQLASLRERIATSEKNPGTNPPKELAELRRQQKALMASAVPPLPPLTDLEIGNLGPLLDGSAKVIQVISDTEMRGQFLSQKAWSVGGQHQADCWQKAVWFQGVDTKKLADGVTITLEGSFIVTGTRRFKIAGGGQRTEFVVEPLDEVRWKSAYQEWKKSAATRPAEQRP
jgi:hypothetical protein